MLPATPDLLKSKRQAPGNDGPTKGQGGQPPPPPRFFFLFLFCFLYLYIIVNLTPFQRINYYLSIKALNIFTLFQL